MSHERGQATALRGVEVLQVPMRDQSELGDRQEPDHGHVFDPGEPRGDARQTDCESTTQHRWEDIGDPSASQAERPDRSVRAVPRYVTLAGTLSGSHSHASVRATRHQGDR